ncbi:MAG: hypothetical protein U5K32_02075 [Bacteroidales bacterium]|nr:hypothetical protein [Bacteroidales bacterium]
MKRTVMSIIAVVLSLTAYSQENTRERSGKTLRQLSGSNDLLLSGDQGINEIRNALRFGKYFSYLYSG